LEIDDNFRSFLLYIINKV